MLPFIEKIFVKPVEFEQISGDKRDEERRKMYSLQEKSSKEIWIVAGELDPGFYNKTFANIISRKLKEIPDFRVGILFSKDENLTCEQRISLIFEQHRALCELLKDGAFEGRFSMFLSKERPENHFGIVDNNILIEKIHKQNDRRDVLLVNNYNNLVERYKRCFIKLAHNKDNIKRLAFYDFQNIIAA